MQVHVRERIISSTGADDIQGIELIQPLWNNYGTLTRVFLGGGTTPSVIVKHIKIPTQSRHPRGFTGELSRKRKIKSYSVETHWYRHQNKQLKSCAPTPKCIDAFDDGGELFLLLEDLGNRGFDKVLRQASWSEVQIVLGWLAHFHGQFIGVSTEGLWPTGTYWHLATRPEELANIEGTRLHEFASLLDARLRNSPYQTIVHGDAKLANFLFNAHHSEVAAVDFQYVGGGCPMKDVAYFVGSCMSGDECERSEAKILTTYFEALQSALSSDLDGAALESEWRELYPLAWADFQRFMQGWSPGHRKLTVYSDATTARAIEQVTNDLLDAAASACVAAGRFIQSQVGNTVAVFSKGFASKASDMVTKIDIEAQTIILKHLQPAMDRYELGVLAEEGLQDDSRLRKHAFWTIDPLDGTQYFVEGQSGYATSIALVDASGRVLLGVVYDPVNDELYTSVIGAGVHLNGRPVAPLDSTASLEAAGRWYADSSLGNHPAFSTFEEQFDIRFAGGAVMNVLQLLRDPMAIYCKAPKPQLGGCAIWDLAAVALMLKECGGHACFFDGSQLNLNRPETVFFNDVGLLFVGARVDLRRQLSRMQELVGIA